MLHVLREGDGIKCRVGSASEKEDVVHGHISHVLFFRRSLRRRAVRDPDI